MIVRPDRSRDRGSILPLVLVVSVVMAIVVVAIASYATTTLRLGQVVEDASDRLAAAQAGVDWQLDKLAYGEPNACLLTSGTSTQVFDGGSINALDPTVTCTQSGLPLAVVDNFAVIITGEGNPTVPLLTVTGAGGASEKVFEGSVYIENAAPASFNFLSDLDIKDGNLLYHDASCPLEIQATSIVIDSRLDFPTPFTGPYCAQGSWDGDPDNDGTVETTAFFSGKEPSVPAPTTFNGLFDAAALEADSVDDSQFPYSYIDPEPVVDPNGCVVWFPGRYRSAPDFEALGDYNYMISGEYFFDDVGLIDLKGSYLLAGYPGTRGPSIVTLNPGDTFDNHLCRDAWWYDGIRQGTKIAADPDKFADPYMQGDRAGATWYFGGDTWVMANGGALEVSGRVKDVGGRDVRTALQTINGPINNAPGAPLSDPYGGSDIAASVRRGDDLIVNTKSGSQSQLSFNGLVWAPAASFEFSNIANDAVAALKGGGVVGTLDAGAAAQTDGFLIRVDSQPSDAKLVIESTATNGGTSTVRAVIDFQTGTNNARVASRRIMELTPE